MVRTRNYRSKRRSTMRSKRQTKHRNNTRRGGVRRKFRRNRRTRKGGSFLRKMFNKGKSYAREYGQGVSAASGSVASGISNKVGNVASGIKTMREKSQARSKARSERANTYANCEEAKRQTAQAKKMYDSAVAQCKKVETLKNAYIDSGANEYDNCPVPARKPEPTVPEPTSQTLFDMQRPPMLRRPSGVM